MSAYEEQIKVRDDKIAVLEYAPSLQPIVVPVILEATELVCLH
jgi:hypothetical protein